uniref:Putative subtilisin inhibitor-like protein n=1 Tax=Saccharopolyspora erythraea (strain ATCC 11635 / DSM 40517 / JCM 4748 / NBRC 13426 / NCIMB 8594 / NRRL 2338) TaxID=405948 RepID=Q8GNT5_SACEN|nr:putative subtilisin inhibitor-like protein precursor [Saccharopolyspora erythraea NRRL 2338]
MSNQRKKTRLNRTFRRILLVLTITAGTTLAPAFANATAVPSGVDVVKQSKIRISVTSDRSNETRNAVLRCQPAGGSHRHAKEACVQLEAADGNLASVQAQQVNAPCTMELDPVTVTAVGRWHGSVVSFEQTYSNSCVLSVQTGAVFDI